jgi:hypothetical protein
MKVSWLIPASADTPEISASSQNAPAKEGQLSVSQLKYPATIDPA